MIIRLTLIERILHRFHLLPTPIMDAFGSIVFGRALTVAVRHGLFEALASSPKTAAELAAKTRFDRQALDILLQSFLVAGYLTTRNDVYKLTGESRKWLVKESPSYLGNLIRYCETLFTRWSYLEHSLEHGKPPRRYYDAFTDDDWTVYVHGMRDLARLFLPHVMKKITLRRSPHHLLDLGGGHGLYAIECCRRYPSLQATVIDFPGALRPTSGFIEEQGMTGRVYLLPGDFTHMELPPSQDCVLMFNVIHGFNEDTNRAIIQQALHLLTPGGKIYILDQLREERTRTGLSQFMPLMVGLNLLNEIGGNTYSYDLVKGWCAGAAAVKRMRLQLPGVSLVEVTR